MTPVAKEKPMTKKATKEANVWRYGEVLINLQDGTTARFLNKHADKLTVCTNETWDNANTLFRDEVTKHGLSANTKISKYVNHRAKIKTTASLFVRKAQYDAVLADPSNKNIVTALQSAEKDEAALLKQLNTVQKAKAQNYQKLLAQTK